MNVNCPSEPLSIREPKGPGDNGFLASAIVALTNGDPLPAAGHKQLTSHRGKGSKAERHTTDPSPLPVFRSLDRNMPQSRA
jgi:hypothetical protein